MANIKINDLKVTGSELFVDQESFLNDLSDSDLTIQGGIYNDGSSFWCRPTTVVGTSFL